MRIDRIAPSLWTRVRRWLRRGAGAVERAGLENRNTRKRIVGSNPTLSANSGRRRFGAAVAFASLLAMASPAGSADSAQRTLSPEVESFIEEMVQRHGFKRAALRRLFTRSEPQPAVIRSISAPLTARPWHEFRRLYVNEARISGGIEFWQKHAATLARASRKYGVPEEIIVATIGMETLYGRRMGEFRVLDALTTLAFDYPPRAGLFRSELEQFLLLARESGFDAAKLKGSYAGAIGWPQFLPSSYRRYAVDFDGDGKRNLAGAPTDAIGSVANYYRSFGWRTGDAIAVPAEADSGAVEALTRLGVKPRLMVSELKGRGVTPTAPVDESAEAALVAVEAENGPQYWLGLKNFYVITRYNRSVNYALAVHELARELRSLGRPGN